MVVAQADNNKILPIVFVVVESETSKTWFFFLKNFERPITPQDGLCLISDMHDSLKSVYLRHDSGWTTQNYVHVFCIRHFALNYMRRFKNNDIRKLIINVGECQTSFSSYSKYHLILYYE